MANIEHCPVCGEPAHPGESDDFGRCASCAQIPPVTVDGVVHHVVGIALQGAVIGARQPKYPEASIERLGTVDLAPATRRRIARGIKNYFHARGQNDTIGENLRIARDVKAGQPLTHSEALMAMRLPGNEVVRPLAQEQLERAQGFEIDHGETREAVAKIAAGAGGEFTEAFKAVEAKVGWESPPCEHHAKRIDIVNETVLVKSDGTKVGETSVVTARATAMSARCDGVAYRKDVWLDCVLPAEHEGPHRWSKEDK